MDDFSLLESKNIKNKICCYKKYFNKIIIKQNLAKIKSSKESNKIEIQDYKNQINNKQKTINKRNAGIDLIRIITMIGIVYTHILFEGKGIYKYSK